MKEIKVLEPVLLEEYDVRCANYLTYAQISQIVKAVANIDDWAERNTVTDMLILAHATDVDKKTLAEIGHEKLQMSGLIDDVKTTICNMYELETAIDQARSLEHNFFLVLKNLTPKITEWVSKLAESKKR